MEENIKELLTSFLGQAKTNNLVTNHYPNSYANLNLKVSFGQGVVARIPWISFLGNNQITSKGIYPVYLLYKEQDILVLAYGISETNTPTLNWKIPSNTQTIKEYFGDNFKIKPARYGNSFVYKVYDLKFSLTWDKVEKDLLILIDEYKSLLNPTTLMPAILEAIKSDLIQKNLNEEEFTFNNAREKLSELERYIEPNNDFYKSLLQKFVKSKSTYTNFVSTLNQESYEFKLLKIIAQLISYCDSHAANKNELNEYDDKRTLANSGVRQTSWVESLLNYKLFNNDIEKLPPSIRNAITYLKDPLNGLTMLSENHREMVAKNLLKIEYEKNSFVKQVLHFFSPYNISPKNELNKTFVICGILYRFPEIKKMWFDEIEGLVVCDNTGWIEEAINSLYTMENIILWWDKKPSGGNEVIKLLRDKIENSDENCFFIYYTINQVAYYRATVRDFAFKDEFLQTGWNSNGKTAWYFNQFDKYKTKKENGKTSFAKILFLVDKIEKLKHPFAVNKIIFYKTFQAPTQNNMQPYTLITVTEEFGNMDKTNVDGNMLTYLNSIKTKPFIILAGLSGTGKSRLVRSLAYKFNNIPTDKSSGKHPPTNFQLIKVRPNWHDSSDLIGYESRISGKDRFVVTDFIRFIVKAHLYPETPFFLCLDEMNLAPVEQYFAEYLSVIETRRINEENNIIVTDSLISKSLINKFSNKSDGVDPDYDLWKELDLSIEEIKESLKANGLTLPRNLIVMGTVNMDETTHSFSRKVLDRAMTVEMNEIDLYAGLDETANEWQYSDNPLSGNFIISEKTHGNQVYEELKKDGNTIIKYLKELNDLLEDTPFKIAYRVRDEFLLYAYNYNLIGDKPEDWLIQTLDKMTLMKILPRIEGDEDKTAILERLLVFFEENKLVDTLHKAEEMEKRRKTFHYTSFWI